MQAPIATLTPRQKRCARYLALGLSQRVTGRRMGMNDRTIRRWLTDVPGFVELVEELRAAGADEDATDTLRDLLYSENEQVRLGAARELLRLQPKQRVDEDEDVDLDSGW